MTAGIETGVGKMRLSGLLDLAENFVESGEVRFIEADRLLEHEIAFDQIGFP